MSAVIYLTSLPPQQRTRTSWNVDSICYKSTSLFCSYAVYLFPNRYLLSTYTGGEQSCQILMFLTVVRHQWVHRRWWDQINSCGAVFSEVFSRGPTLPCGDQWGNTTIRWCAPGFGKPKISVGLLLSFVKLGPNDVVTLHPYFAVQDPKLFIVTCVVLWGVFGWVRTKHAPKSPYCKQRHLQWCAEQRERAGRYLSPLGSLENSHLTVVILMWPWPSENTPKHKTPGQTKRHLLFRTNNSLSVSDFFFFSFYRKRKITKFKNWSF